MNKKKTLILERELTKLHDLVFKHDTFKLWIIDEVDNLEPAVDDTPTCVHANLMALETVIQLQYHLAHLMVYVKWISNLSNTGIEYNDLQQKFNMALLNIGDVFIGPKDYKSGILYANTFDCWMASTDNAAYKEFSDARESLRLFFAEEDRQLRHNETHNKIKANDILDIYKTDAIVNRFMSDKNKSRVLHLFKKLLTSMGKVIENQDVLSMNKSIDMTRVLEVEYGRLFNKTGNIGTRQSNKYIPKKDLNEIIRKLQYIFKEESKPEDVNDAVVYINYLYSQIVIGKKLYYNSSTVFESQVALKDLYVRAAEAFKILWGYSARSKNIWKQYVKPVLKNSKLGFDEDITNVEADLQYFVTEQIFDKELRDTLVHGDKNIFAHLDKLSGLDATEVLEIVTSVEFVLKDVFKLLLTCKTDY